MLEKFVEGNTKANHTLTSRWIGWLTLSGLPLLAFPPPPPKHFIHGIPRVFSRLSVASCSRLRFFSFLLLSFSLPCQSLARSRPPSANPSRLPRLYVVIYVSRSLHLADLLKSWESRALSNRIQPRT